VNVLSENNDSAVIQQPNFRGGSIGEAGLLGLPVNIPVQLPVNVLSTNKNSPSLQQSSYRGISGGENSLLKLPVNLPIQGEVNLGSTNIGSPALQQSPGTLPGVILPGVVSRPMGGGGLLPKAGGNLILTSLVGLTFILTGATLRRKF
jgi:hypothetical protein